MEIVFFYKHTNKVYKIDILEIEKQQQGTFKRKIQLSNMLISSFKKHTEFSNLIVETAHARCYASHFT